MKKLEAILRKFYMGNGITTTDRTKAANDLLHRDHKKLLQFLRGFQNGQKLGTYFVPPMFISQVPEVIKPCDYSAKTDDKGTHKDMLKGQIAEKIMFEELKKHFEKTQDNVIIFHSHKFLENDSNSEKDFILVNLTKGYVLIIEVKSRDFRYQKSVKQMFHAKAKIEEVFGDIGVSTKFLYVGVFFAQFGSVKPIFDCDCTADCSKFAIVGPENIAESFAQIEEEIAMSHENWNPSEHIKEFIEIAKNLMFIAQGDPFAPVTDSSLVDKISNHVLDSSSFENTFFWSLEQLSLIDAIGLCFVFLDAFYSTGKSLILKYMAEFWSRQNLVVHYLINRSDNGENLLSKLPFTLMVENEFKKTNILVKETSFKFGVDDVEPFLRENGIESDHVVCFDEVICKNFSTSFIDGLKEMKDQVGALWVAIGAKPILGRFSVKALEKSGFICPNLTFPLRNPLSIAKNAHKVSMDGAKNLQDGILQNDIDISPETNIVEGKLIILETIFSSCLDAIDATLKEIPAMKSTMLFVENSTLSGAVIKEIFVSHSRPIPIILTETEWDNEKAQRWLCKPKSRTNDLCFIIGANHNCNGIETDIVSYVLPGPCPNCEFSSEDPIIASRATAMQIMARYKRSKCPHCGEVEEDEKSEDEPVKKRNKMLTSEAPEEVKPNYKEEPSKLEEKTNELALTTRCDTEVLEKDFATFKPILPIDINSQVGNMLDVNVTLALDPSRFKVCT